MRPIGMLALGAALTAGAAFAAGGAPCVHEVSAAGMTARVNTMRDQMDRIEVTTDAAEQHKLLQLNMKHVREGLHELRKRDDLSVACRLDLMNAMLDTLARHEVVAQERRDR